MITIVVNGFQLGDNREGCTPLWTSTRESTTTSTQNVTNSAGNDNQNLHSNRDFNCFRVFFSLLTIKLFKF